MMQKPFARMLRKDLRLMRGPFIFGLVTIAMIYASAAVSAAIHLARAAPTFTRPVEPEIRAMVLEFHQRTNRINALHFDVIPAAARGVGVAALVAGACGAIAFARERRDRSAEFLAMLPVSRVRIAASKTIAAVLYAIPPLLFHAAVIAVGWRLLAAFQFDGLQKYTAPLVTGAWYHASLGVLFFGVAWLASVFARSPSVAGVAALTIAVLTVFITASYGWAAEAAAAGAVKDQWWGPSDMIWSIVNVNSYRFTPAHVFAVVNAAALVVGALALAFGTAVYVRRVEP